jgi:hypothetical protein
LNAKLLWCRFGALFEQSSAELPAQSLYNLFINSEINQVIPKAFNQFRNNSVENLEGKWRRSAVEEARGNSGVEEMPRRW